MGYIRKALEKGYLEHPGSACCTDEMLEIFVRFGSCTSCLLPPFVNRQLPCLHTNSHNVLLPPPMHHRNLWCAKVVQTPKSLASMLKNIVSYPPLTHAFLKWPFLTDFKKYTHTPPTD